MSTFTNDMIVLKELAADIDIQSAIVKMAKSESAALKNLASVLMAKHQLKTASLHELQVSRYDAGSKSSLSEVKLLENGVDAEVIADSKVKGKPSFTVKVTELKNPKSQYIKAGE